MTDIDLLQDWKGSRKGPYRVKCRHCGYEYKAKFHGKRCTTPCPQCTGKLSREEHLKRWNFEVLSDEFKITTVDKYPVRGMCGHTWITSLAAPSECPVCREQRLKKGVKVPQGWELAVYGSGKNRNGNLLHLFRQESTGLLLEDVSGVPSGHKFDIYEKHLRGTSLKLYSLSPLILECKVCGNTFKPSKITAIKHGQTTVCPSCKRGNYASKREADFKEWLTSKGYAVRQSDRTIARNPDTGRYFEADLYLPDEKIAIEFNGFRYHATNGVFPKDRFYHQRKSEAFLKEGVSLYQFWEDETDEDIKEWLTFVLESRVPLEGKMFDRDKYPDPSLFERKVVSVAPSCIRFVHTKQIVGDIMVQRGRHEQTPDGTKHWECWQSGWWRLE